MKKRKNTTAKIMASIALIAILLGIVGTGVLVIVSSLGGGHETVSQQELDEYLESLSGSISASGSEGL
ncbi:hypothetical protein LR010_03350 [Candidatus Gracilibacteria bacterium]|nr:hypothetical protein [Candidatus Gracilibacteria bacterium]